LYGILGRKNDLRAMNTQAGIQKMAKKRKKIKRRMEMKMKADDLELGVFPTHNTKSEI
jgi:hypothetical protein